MCDCNDVCGGRDPYPGACPANETALAPGKLRGCPPFANCCTNSTRVCGVYNNETAACDPVVMPPPEWTCGVDKWGDGVCDCGYTCGAWDLFDCENVTGVYTHGTSLRGCPLIPGNDVNEGCCFAPGADVTNTTARCGSHTPSGGSGDVCSFPEPPPGWTCDPALWGDGACSCSCGVADIDCPTDPGVAVAEGVAMPSCGPFSDCCYVHPDGNTQCGRVKSSPHYPDIPPACYPDPSFGYVPSDWACDEFQYGDGYCECGLSSVMAMGSPPPNCGVIDFVDCFEGEPSFQDSTAFAEYSGTHRCCLAVNTTHFVGPGEAGYFNGTACLRIEAAPVGFTTPSAWNDGRCDCGDSGVYDFYDCDVSQPVSPLDERIIKKVFLTGGGTGCGIGAKCCSTDSVADGECGYTPDGGLTCNALADKGHAPAGWTCADFRFGDNACDCTACGVYDLPDCHRTLTPLAPEDSFGIPTFTGCGLLPDTFGVDCCDFTYSDAPTNLVPDVNAEGRCAFYNATSRSCRDPINLDPPAEWTCSAGRYGDSKCHCTGCGAFDRFDCLLPPQLNGSYTIVGPDDSSWGDCPVMTECCLASDGFNSNGTCGYLDPTGLGCLPLPPVPAGWTCAPSKWGDGNCDCAACGVYDEIDCDILWEQNFRQLAPGSCGIGADCCAMGGLNNDDPNRKSVCGVFNATSSFPSSCQPLPAPPEEWSCPGSNFGDTVCSCTSCTAYDYKDCTANVFDRIISSSFPPNVFAIPTGCESYNGEANCCALPNADGLLNDPLLSQIIGITNQTCGKLRVVSASGDPLGVDDGVRNLETQCFPLPMVPGVPVPDEWTCSPFRWGDGVCDCGGSCGAYDVLDCVFDVSIYAEFDAFAGTTTGAADVPFSIRGCPPEANCCYNSTLAGTVPSGTGVCGNVTDVDALSGLPVCSDLVFVIPPSPRNPPEGWTCPESFYDDGEVCDCSYCGALDPDCIDPTVTSVTGCGGSSPGSGPACCAPPSALFPTGKCGISSGGSCVVNNGFSGSCQNLCGTFVDAECSCDGLCLENNNCCPDFGSECPNVALSEFSPQPCAPGCLPWLVGDGICDRACDNVACVFDQGDCTVPECAPGCSELDVGDGECQIECMQPGCSLDGGDCDNLRLWHKYPELKAGWTCPREAFGDGVCDCQCGSTFDVDCFLQETSGVVASGVEQRGCAVSGGATPCCVRGPLGGGQCGSVNATDQCVRPNVPDSWECAPERYRDGAVCDCNCGAPMDPDCIDVPGPYTYSPVQLRGCPMEDFEQVLGNGEALSPVQINSRLRGYIGCCAPRSPLGNNTQCGIPVFPDGTSEPAFECRQPANVALGVPDELEFLKFEEFSLQLNINILTIRIPVYLFNFAPGEVVTLIMGYENLRDGMNGITLTKGTGTESFSHTIVGDTPIERADYITQIDTIGFGMDLNLEISDVFTNAGRTQSVFGKLAVNSDLSDDAVTYRVNGPVVDVLITHDPNSVPCFLGSQFRSFTAFLGKDKASDPGDEFQTLSHAEFFLDSAVNTPLCNVSLTGKEYPFTAECRADLYNGPGGVVELGDKYCERVHTLVVYATSAGGQRGPPATTLVQFEMTANTNNDGLRKKDEPNATPNQYGPSPPASHEKPLTPLNENLIDKSGGEETGPRGGGGSTTAGDVRPGGETTTDTSPLPTPGLHPHLAVRHALGGVTTTKGASQIHSRIRLSDSRGVLPTTRMSHGSSRAAASIYGVEYVIPSIDIPFSRNLPLATSPTLSSRWASVSAASAADGAPSGGGAAGRTHRVSSTGVVVRGLHDGLANEPPCYGWTGCSPSDYHGCHGKTVSKRRCQTWRNQAPHAHPWAPEEHPDADLGYNYCRDPDGSGTTWCYTVDPLVRREQCPFFPVNNVLGFPLSEEKCLARMDVACERDRNGASYRGNMDRDVYGRKCLNWFDSGYWRRYPNAGLIGAECRNPGESRFPWCFVAPGVKGICNPGRDILHDEKTNMTRWRWTDRCKPFPYISPRQAVSSPTAEAITTGRTPAQILRDVVETPPPPPPPPGSSSTIAEVCYTYDTPGKPPSEPKTEAKGTNKKVGDDKKSGPAVSVTVTFETCLLARTLSVTTTISGELEAKSGVYGAIVGGGIATYECPQGDFPPAFDRCKNTRYTFFLDIEVGYQKSADFGVVSAIIKAGIVAKFRFEFLPCPSCTLGVVLDRALIGVGFTFLAEASLNAVVVVVTVGMTLDLVVGVRLPATSISDAFMGLEFLGVCYFSWSIGLGKLSISKRYDFSFGFHVKAKVIDQFALDAGDHPVCVFNTSDPNLKVAPPGPHSTSSPDDKPLASSDRARRTRVYNPGSDFNEALMEEIGARSATREVITIHQASVFQAPSEHHAREHNDGQRVWHGHAVLGTRDLGSETHTNHPATLQYKAATHVASMHSDWHSRLSTAEDAHDAPGVHRVRHHHAHRVYDRHAPHTLNYFRRALDANTARKSRHSNVKSVLKEHAPHPESPHDEIVATQAALKALALDSLPFPTPLRAASHGFVDTSVLFDHASLDPTMPLPVTAQSLFDGRMVMCWKSARSGDGASSVECAHRARSWSSGSQPWAGTHTTWDVSLSAVAPTSWRDEGPYTVFATFLAMPNSVLLPPSVESMSDSEILEWGANHTIVMASAFSSETLTWSSPVQLFSPRETSLEAVFGVGNGHIASGVQMVMSRQDPGAGPVFAVWMARTELDVLSTAPPGTTTLAYASLNVSSSSPDVVANSEPRVIPGLTTILVGSIPKLAATNKTVAVVFTSPKANVTFDLYVMVYTVSTDSWSGPTLIEGDAPINSFDVAATGKGDSYVLTWGGSYATRVCRFQGDVPSTCASTGGQFVYRAAMLSNGTDLNAPGSSKTVLLKEHELLSLDDVNAVKTVVAVETGDGVAVVGTEVLGSHMLYSVVEWPSGEVAPYERRVELWLRNSTISNMMAPRQAIGARSVVVTTMERTLFPARNLTTGATSANKSVSYIDMYSTTLALGPELLIETIDYEFIPGIDGGIVNDTGPVTNVTGPSVGAGMAFNVTVRNLGSSPAASMSVQLWAGDANRPRTMIHPGVGNVTLNPGELFTLDSVLAMDGTTTNPFLWIVASDPRLPSNSVGSKRRFIPGAFLFDPVTIVGVGNKLRAVTAIVSESPLPAKLPVEVYTIQTAENIYAQEEMYTPIVLGRLEDVYVGPYQTQILEFDVTDMLTLPRINNNLVFHVPLDAHEVRADMVAHQVSLLVDWGMEESSIQVAAVGEGKLAYSVDVFNAGTRPAPEGSLDFIQLNDPSLAFNRSAIATAIAEGDTSVAEVLASVTVPPLGSRARTTLSGMASAPALGAGANITIMVMVNREAVMKEVTFGNNMALRLIEYIPPSAIVSLDSVSATSNSNLTAFVVLRNDGLVTAQSVLIEVSSSRFGDHPRIPTSYVKSPPIPPLGATVEVPIKLAITSDDFGSRSSFNISVRLDPFDAKPNLVRIKHQPTRRSRVSRSWSSRSAEEVDEMLRLRSLSRSVRNAVLGNAQVLETADREEVTVQTPVFKADQAIQLFLNGQGNGEGDDDALVELWVLIVAGSVLVLCLAVSVFLVLRQRRHREHHARNGKSPSPPPGNGAASAGMDSFEAPVDASMTLRKDGEPLFTTADASHVDGSTDTTGTTTSTATGSSLSISSASTFSSTSGSSSRSSSSASSTSGTSSSSISWF